MRTDTSQKAFNPARVVALGIALLGVQACSQSSPTALRTPTASAVLSVEQVFESQHSGVQDVRRLVVRDQATWQQVWSDLQGPGTTTPALPAIDFNRDMVLVATLGTKPTGGYRIVVGPSVQADTEVVVYVQKVVPGMKCGTVQMVTHPFSVVSVARSSLPVRFVETEEVNDCK